MPRKENSHPPRSLARLVSIAGNSLPEEALATPLIKAGFDCRVSSIAELKAGESSCGAILLWVGEDWDAGFSMIEAWPEALRSAVVLIGKRNARGLIRRVVHIGALAAVAFPMPEWFPAPLAAALTRLENPSRRRLSEVLEELQNAQEEPLEPEDLLGRVTDSAARLLGADLAVPVLKLADGALALVRTADGTIVAEPWKARSERLRAPFGLGRLMEERQETLIVPTVTHGKHFRPGRGAAAFDAAILLPILLHGNALGGSAPLLASLNLYWRQPFLPTAAELSCLEVLKTIARSAVTLLSSQARSATLHAITHRIYAEALRAVPRSGADSSEASWRYLAEELAGAYARWPRLQALWIRPPQLRGASEESWIAFPPGVPEAPFPREPHAPSDNPELMKLPGGWAVRAFAKNAEPRYGEIVALFSSRSAASVARNDVMGLAADLFTTYGLRQRAEDTSTLFQLTVPSRIEEAQSDLLQSIKIVKDRLASDGAKVFVMARDAEGPKIWQLANTDFPNAAPKPLRFLAEQGLADWVINNGTWLLAPQLIKRHGKTPEKCWSEDGEQEVYSRPEIDHWPAHPDPDREETMLLVPLLAEGQTIGALAVWREFPSPYDKELDPGSLLYFAPLVATACRRMLQLLKGREELLAIEHLTKSLARSRSLPEAWSVVVAGVRELASSKVAVLLRFDSEAGDYFLASSSYSIPNMDPEGISNLPHFRCSILRDGEMYSAVRAALEARLPAFSLRAILIPEGSNGPAPVIVALFDAHRTTSEPLLLPDDLLDHYARSYLQTASGMLEGYPDALARHLVDDIGLGENWAEVSAEQILEQAAERLWEVTGAEAVILYTGTEEQMTVQSSRPRGNNLQDITVSPESLTRQAIITRSLKRILDVEVHGGGMNRANLIWIEKALGWEASGSWLCCPLVHRNRSVGLIELLTSNTGPFLGPDQGRITEIVAARTASEMYKASSREHWRDLLVFVREISEFYGQRFEQELPRSLVEWLRKALLRPRCEIAIVSRMGSENLSSLQLASPGARAWLEPLVVVSQKRGSSSLKASPVGSATEIQQPTRGVIATLFLPVEGRLAGHLFVLDSARFYPDDLEIIERATQHLAFLLDSELRREEWRQTMGRFRHTILAPVQGLASAAKKLALDAERAGTPREVIDEQRLVILKESELIRLWRENHRFYLSRDIKLVRRREQLIHIFERCAYRYRPLAEQRDITLTLDFPLRGGLQADVDAAALDVALSNLIDNACKYAFYHRSLVLGARAMGGMLRIWVEDVGNPVPPEVDNQIYRFGNRGSISDPLRAITGQGIGLGLVMLIVAAHDGSLTHSSVREGSRSQEDTSTTPYRVRFTINLPRFSGTTGMARLE